ncbi:UNVERIFIED_CONTAM: hypothetical protein HDU68_003819, partial [Siphonaria sp. JEL0065]
MDSHTSRSDSDTTSQSQDEQDFMYLSNLPIATRELSLLFVWNDRDCETFVTDAVELASSTPQPNFMS